MQTILFKQNNQIAVLMPTQEALSQYNIQAIALKDVPEGCPFWIVDASTLPQDIPQEAWEIDESENPPDGYGSQYYTFEEVLNND